MGRMLCGRKELNITISFIQHTFVKHIIYSRQWTFKDKYSCPQEFTVQRGGKQGNIQVEYNSIRLVLNTQENTTKFTSRSTDYGQKKLPEELTPGVRLSFPLKHAWWWMQAPLEAAQSPSDLANAINRKLSALCLPCLSRAANLSGLLASPPGSAILAACHWVGN